MPVDVPLDDRMLIFCPNWQVRYVVVFEQVVHRLIAAQLQRLQLIIVPVLVRKQVLGIALTHRVAVHLPVLHVALLADEGPAPHDEVRSARRPAVDAVNVVCHAECTFLQESLDLILHRVIR